MKLIEIKGYEKGQPTTGTQESTANKGPEDKSEIPVGTEQYFQIRGELSMQDGILFQWWKLLSLTRYIGMSCKKYILHTWALTAVLDSLKTVFTD